MARGPSPRELKAAWQQRLKSARSVYAEKVAIRKEMLAEHGDRVWPINLEPNPDGRFALHQALQEESAARKEYMPVLRMFNELMREGTLPEEVPRLFLVDRETGSYLYWLSTMNDEQNQETPFQVTAREAVERILSTREPVAQNRRMNVAVGFLFACKCGILPRTGDSSVDARPSRRELEAAWRERVDRARARYAEKIAIRRQMVAERPVWPIKLAPDPDGRFALNLALQEESAARTEYMRLLRIYAGLILHGTPPEEEPSS